MTKSYKAPCDDIPQPTIMSLGTSMPLLHHYFDFRIDRIVIIIIIIIDRIVAIH